LYDPKEYEGVVKISTKSADPNLTRGYWASNLSIPILAKEIRTFQGSCFSLHSEEFATVEKRYQGMKYLYLSEPIYHT